MTVSRRLVALGLCLTFILMVGAAGPQAAPAKAQDAEAAATTVIYNLYATDGYVTMADGTRQYIYGFIGGRQGTTIQWLDKNNLLQPATPLAVPDPTGGPITAAEAVLAGNAQFPAPIIYAAVGDVVEIRLKNLGVTLRSAPNDPHTIHLHGLDVNAANDGVPETSVAAVPATAANVGAGNVVVYMFAPTQPGTYMYHCHQEASIHVQMGMYGALVVYNPGDPAYLNGGPGKGFGGSLYGYNYTKDVVLLLSEFDPRQHKAEERGGPFNPVQFQPTYWFINGLSFPNTIHAGLGFNWNNWIAAHPGYDPFIVGSVGTPDQVLLRVINMGFQAQPMHMHGFHATVIGSDQRDWYWTGGGLQKNTLLIGSGETYEWLINFGEQAMATGTYPGGSPYPLPPAAPQFDGNTQTRYYNTAVAACVTDVAAWAAANGVPVPVANAPVANTLLNCPAIPDPFVPLAAYIGGPVVGPDSLASQGPGGLPPELPITTGQYFPFHNHDDYKATNNGVYPGGMFTMIEARP